MLDIPRRDQLESLIAAANAVAPTTTLGLARATANGRVSVQYAYEFGFGEFGLPADGLPSALVASAGGVIVNDRATLEANRTRAAEAFLLDNHAASLVSLPIEGVQAATRLWVAFGDAPALSPDHVN